MLKSTFMIEIPVIPIPEVVFFPHTVLPLLIQEPTYQKLIREAISKQGFVAVSMARKTNQSALFKGEKLPLFVPAPVCSMGVPIIVDESANGLKVLIKGTHRVQLLSIKTNHPYPVFYAQVKNDNREIIDNSFGQIQQIADMLDNWVALTVSDMSEREAFYSGLFSACHIINYSAMLMIGDRDVRQLLLECDSSMERINLLFLLLHGRSPLEENPRVSQAIKRFEIIEKLAAGQ